MAYLRHATTLNSVVAFGSGLRAIRVHPCFEPNPRVRAVLTLNYDCFLEAGATQKCNAGRLKPMASKNSRDDPSRLPVYHIHGYIPYGIGRKPRHRLVLTADSYQDAYRPGTFTRETLDGFLSRFPALFIGVSFDDELLLRRLEELTREDRSAGHFALLMKDDSDPALLDRLVSSAGVQPILYRRHEQIPAILGHVYQTGLTPEDLRVLLESGPQAPVGYEQLSQEDYWTLLLYIKK